MQVEPGMESGTISSSTLTRGLCKTEIAEAFGVSLPTVEAWVRRGCPVLQRGSRGKRYTFSLPEVTDWLRTQRSGKREPLDLTRERAELIAVQKEREKLRLAEDRGRLVPADKIEQVWSDLVLAFRARILARSKKLAPRLEGLTTAEIERLLHESDNEALAELSANGGRKPRGRGTRKPPAKGARKGQAAAPSDPEPVGA
jgi:phage terminase Nu1 subunit (DNA packaging protein)